MIPDELLLESIIQSITENNLFRIVDIEIFRQKVRNGKITIEDIGFMIENKIIDEANNLVQANHE